MLLTYPMSRPEIGESRQPGPSPRENLDADNLPSSAAAIAASGLLLLQEQVNKSLKGCDPHNYTTAATNLLSAAVDLALADEITFSFIDRNHPNATLGAVTDVATPANTSISKGFESILMHGTANNNPNAGEGRSWDTGLVYGDFYLIEAGNRLLEMGWAKWTSRSFEHGTWGL